MTEPRDSGTQPPAGDDAGGKGVPDALQVLAAAAAAIASDLARLFALEVRLCGRTILAMLALTIVGALLAAGGWLYLSAAAVILLSRIEAIGPAGATAIVGLIHLALAVAAWWRVRLISRDVTFRQSRAALRGLMVAEREEQP